MRALALFVPLALATACARPSGAPPSLQPRAAEMIDPRVPVSGPVNDRPVTSALASRLAQLIDQAEAGTGAFNLAAQRAEQMASGAGARESESWKVAQEALSAAVAARAPTTRALSDIDALGADALQSQGGMPPADLAAVQAAGERISALDRRQAARLHTIQQRLGT